MTFTKASYLIVGTLCTIGGAGVLYFSWKSKIQLKESFNVLGWSLLVAALFSWTGLNGWEFGTLYAITLPSLAALLYVSYNAELNGSSVAAPSFKPIKKPTGRQALSFIGKLLLILPFALTASIFVSYGVSILAVQSELNQLVMAICILPIIWGFFAYWLLADTRLVRPVASQIGLASLFVVQVLQV
ncbi:MAG: hypothetical protein MI746_09470 [Pseudomonadales bacterium]|nr:hypothetical protein [Pseudomonadales bacterium]